MATTVRITETELLETLASTIRGSAPKDARTVAELADELKCQRSKVTRALGVLQRQNRLVVHRTNVVGIDGRNVSVPAYTILPAKKR